MMNVSGNDCAVLDMEIVAPELTAGATKNIPLSQMALPSHDIKPDRKPEDILAMLESLLQHGLLTPLLGFWRADGMFELLDGYTRFLALTMTGSFKEAPIRDLGRIPSPAEAHVIQVTCNLAHAEMTDLQLADAIAYQRKLTGGTQKAACKELGISEGRGSRIRAMFTKLPPEVFEIESRPRGLYALSQLHSLGDIPLIIDLATKARDVPWAVETLEEKVHELLGTRKKRKPKPLTLNFDGVRMIFNNPTIEAVQGSLERVLAGLKRLAKDGDGIEYLPTRLKPT